MIGAALLWLLFVFPPFLPLHNNLCALFGSLVHKTADWVSVSLCRFFIVFFLNVFFNFNFVLYIRLSARVSMCVHVDNSIVVGCNIHTLTVCMEWIEWRGRGYFCCQMEFVHSFLYVGLRCSFILNHHPFVRAFVALCRIATQKQNYQNRTTE